MIAFKLPKNFLIGTATSATQIESGIDNNNWSEWAKLNKIKDGSSPLKTADHWLLIDEDIKLLKQINCKTYRMSIEWSRIEPQRNQFDENAIEHYRYELKKLIEADIKPIVTLHHFTNPIWFENEGAWLAKDAVDKFLNYVRYAIEKLGDLVTDWCTINEPNVYSYTGYVVGYFPPGEKRKYRKYFAISKTMIIAHIESYKLIHEIRKEMGYNDSNVGFALHLRLFQPKVKYPIEKILTRIVTHNFNNLFLYGMSEGLLFLLYIKYFYRGKSGDYMDYIGINYYSRDKVKFTFSYTNLFSKQANDTHKPKSDLGWEIYPRGIYKLCEKIYRRYKKPIYILENGVADANDVFRSKFIYDHLYQIKRLIDKGIDVQRYYYWSFLDNFEWMEGLNPRFGLFEIDYTTMARKMRKSAEFFAKISEKNSVTADMIDEYLLIND